MNHGVSKKKNQQFLVLYGLAYLNNNFYLILTKSLRSYDIFDSLLTIETETII